MSVEKQICSGECDDLFGCCCCKAVACRHQSEVPLLPNVTSQGDRGQFCKALIAPNVLLGSLLQKKGLLFPEYGCRPNLVTSLLRMSFYADANCYVTQFHLSVFLSFLLPYVWSSNSSSLLLLMCCSSEEIKLGKCAAFKRIKLNPLIF